MIKYQQYNPFGAHTSTSLSAGGVRKYDYEIGRFTGVDPLWEKYTGWTGYQYSLNNPVNLVDFNGLNWFSTESGSIKWFYQQGDFSQISSGTTWTDMGEDFLKFNGSELTLYKSDKSSTSWPAVSGKLKDGKTDPDSQWENGGPIPEGTHYSVNPKEIQKWDNISFWDKLASTIGRGTWKWGTSVWGDIRVPINPKKDTRGERTGGYFIHGGNAPGSKGCIDLWKFNKSFFNDFKKYNIPLHLVVIYP
ncbi:MAG TPA: RHS repeat-associated core domain-containing protein [Candidatus Kapabacteria bacterium]|nr:RHS repeat-associated core domain-containing protein [Candidatus Kapabacteria bacterium]